MFESVEEIKLPALENKVQICVGRNNVRVWRIGQNVSFTKRWMPQFSKEETRLYKVSSSGAS